MHANETVFVCQLSYLPLWFAYLWTERLATGKNEKEYSWHVPAMKFIGMEQLV